MGPSVLRWTPGLVLSIKGEREMAGSASASVSTGQRPDDRGRIPGYAGENRWRRHNRAISALGTAYYHISRLEFKDKEDRTCEKIPENGAGHFPKKRRLEFAV